MVRDAAAMAQPRLGAELQDILAPRPDALYRPSDASPLFQPRRTQSMLSTGAIQTSSYQSPRAARRDGAITTALPEELTRAAPYEAPLVSSGTGTRGPSSRTVSIRAEVSAKLPFSPPAGTLGRHPVPRVRCFRSTIFSANTTRRVRSMSR